MPFLIPRRAGRLSGSIAAGTYGKIVHTAGWRAMVHVVLWTILVKVGLIVGGLQAAAVQYLVN